VSKESSYVHLKQYSYREKDVFVARSVHIGDCVVIGKGSRIDENSTIQKTIIGPGCVIQNNVDIIDSHIWEGRNITVVNIICSHLSFVLQDVSLIPVRRYQNPL